MRYLASLLAALLFVFVCHARPPQAPPVRARAALALARPPQAPPVRGICQCEKKQDCVCNGVRCDCPNCWCRDCPGFSQEQQWRAEGWQQDAAGQWFRVVGPASSLVTPAGYSAPGPLAPAFYQPMFFGGGFGGCVGGG